MENEDSVRAAILKFKNKVRGPYKYICPAEVLNTAD